MLSWHLAVPIPYFSTRLYSTPDEARSWQIVGGDISDDIDFCIDRKGTKLIVSDGHNLVEIWLEFMTVGITMHGAYGIRLTPL